MAAVSGFPSLCQELSRIQIRLFQRQGSATILSTEAVQLVHNNLEVVQATSVNAAFVPLFLKSCASLFQHCPPQVNVAAYEVLDATSRLASHYVGNRTGDVNESSSVLRSVLALEESYSKIAAAPGKGLLSPDAPTFETNPFARIVQPAYSTAYEKWHQQRVKPSTLSVLSLVSGTASVYGRSFQFTPASHDIRGLLPCKSRVLMEAKLQRCLGVRELLTYLRGMEFNRLDAGMSLNTMAESGFYDEEICNKCCGVLYSAHALVTSQQLCEVLYSLGVLQHRHIHARFFSSLVNFKECDASATLRHMLGLAMLQQPPVQHKYLMDGLFLHALRASPKSSRHHHRNDRRREAAAEHAPAKQHELSPLWFVDAAHALSCLNIHHYKFKLMTARHVRQCIAKLSTLEQCKLLYGLAGVRPDEVPAELQPAWLSKVERVKDILFKKLEDVTTEDGPQVMSALHYCGIQEHPSIPKMPDLTSRTENPADVILRTWSRTSKERILELTEQLQPHHLRRDQPAKVAQVVTRVADSVGAASPQNSYRFGPLVAAVDATGARMTTQETIRTIIALQRMDLVAHYTSSLEGLLANLWSRRAEMTDEELADCTRAVKRLRHLEKAAQLVSYCTSHSAVSSV